MKLKMQVYGNSGVGKTTLLGTVLDCPEMCPALLLDVDRTTQSIESKVRFIELSQMGNPEEGKLDTIQIKRWTDFQAVYDRIFAKEVPYKTVMIDTLSEVHYVLLQYLTEADTSPRLDPDIPEPMDYQKAVRLMKKMLRAFRDLDINTVYTAQPKVYTSDYTNISQIMPRFVGGLVDEILPLIPIIGYLQAGVGNSSSQRVLICQPRGRIIAKDGTEGGKLGETIVNPTLREIYKKLTQKEV